MSGELDTPTDTPMDDEQDTDDLDREELLARAELLEEENRRLREEYARARRSQYRRSAIGMAAIGLLAILGGVVFAASRSVLFALGAVGLFGALLTYYLTPERFVAASVGEGVYDAVSRNGEALVSALGLADDRLYVPLDDATRPATLFVPQNDSYALPETFDGPFVVPGDASRRGLSLQPTGAALFVEFAEVLTGPLADDPTNLADQLADGLVHEFELADGATPELDADGAGVAVAITDPAFGDGTGFDHPIVSFLGVGFAVGLDRPVEVEVAAGGDRADVLVTCSWEPGEEMESSAGEEANATNEGAS